MNTTLTTALLVTGCGCTTQTAGAWLAPLQAAVTKFNIDQTPEGLAAFLANIGVESAGLSQLEENLNYSAQGLANTWPSRYAVGGVAVPQRVPNDLAVQIARNPQAIANTTYANRMGNGDVNSGDGWRFRGEGPMQLTGRSQFMAFFAAAGLPLQTDPTTLQEPVNGSLSAAWYFSTSGALASANECTASSFADSVLKVNGQLPCAANQGDLRSTRYSAALAAIQAAPAAPAKKPPVTKTAPSTSQNP